MTTYRLERRGVLMHPDPDDPNEAWGVLNPACARGPDGQRYLLPRLVAKDNESRVGLARITDDGAGDPVGVERLGVVLEPQERWEVNARTGGVEDPRVTWIDALGCYLMTYTAYGALGGRVGLAVSDDLRSWRRLGPLLFAYDPEFGADLNTYPNKDAVWFPEPVADPEGRESLAVLHRPSWDLSEIAVTGYDAVPGHLEDTRPGIWISYVPLEEVQRDLRRLALVQSHRQVAVSEQPWESLKIGGGTPPVRTEDGWLSVFHGVAGEYTPGTDLQPNVRYCAGVMVHDPDDVSRLVHRSSEPLLEPETDEEREGIVPNVVFPTGIDVRGDGEADVFYGMADSRIGWARLTWG